jgi:membrane-associated phospholipid phosphatase
MPSLHIAAANPSNSLSASTVNVRRTASQSFLYFVLWTTAIAVAFAMDRPLALWLRDSGIAQEIKSLGWPRQAAKVPGYFHCTLIVAIALLVWHPLRWRAAVFLAVCALVAGSNSVLKWMVGRSRPFKLPPVDLAQPFRCSPFNGGMTGLVHQSNDLSFVSGHTALAFATAAALVFLFPKSRSIGYVVYSVAMLVLMERVSENAHWLSDAVCGAALGVGGVALVAKVCGGFLVPREV